MVVLGDAVVLAVVVLLDDDLNFFLILTMGKSGVKGLGATVDTNRMIALPPCAPLALAEPLVEDLMSGWAVGKLGTGRVVLLALPADVLGVVDDLVTALLGVVGLLVLVVVVVVCAEVVAFEVVVVTLVVVVVEVDVVVVVVAVVVVVLALVCFNVEIVVETTGSILTVVCCLTFVRSPNNSLLDVTSDSVVAVVDFLVVEVEDVVVDVLVFLPKTNVFLSVSGDSVEV